MSTLPIGGYSEAEWDHQAFLYWPEDGTIVLPVSPGWGHCGIADDLLRRQLQHEPGGWRGRCPVAGHRVDRTWHRVEHESRDDSGCWNPLQRSMVIGSELVTVGHDQMQFTDSSPLAARDSVEWGTPDQYGCYYYR